MTLPAAYYDDGLVRIYHGNAVGHLPGLLAELGDAPAVMVTDPPYGMAFRSGMGGAFGDSEVEGDADTAIRDEVLALWGDRPALVFGRWSVPRPGHTRAVLTWEKGNHVGMGDLELPSQDRRAAVAGEPGAEDVDLLGVRLPYLAIAGTVGQAGKGTRHHPTEKPVDLMRDLLAKCPPGLIVDPFMGSGTTLRAAKDLGRPAVGIELYNTTARPYCRAAVARLGQESIFAHLAPPAAGEQVAFDA